MEILQWSVNLQHTDISERLAIMKSLTILIFISFIMVICSQFTCNPTTDCLSVPPASFVPDPYNCYNYYVCLSNSKPSDSSAPCAAGTYFQVAPDGTIGSCSKGTCINEYCAGKVVENCKLTCSKNGDLIGDPNNCATYYQCTSSGTVKYTCSEPVPYFNGKGCVSSASECCNFCVPYCYQTGQYNIADPYDCTKCYICSTQGITSDIADCPPGFHFDVAKAGCVQGSTCQPICGGPTTLPTTTTTAAGTCTCSTNGNFAIGNCISSYCYCYNDIHEIRYCTDTNVFNTNPSYPYCVAPADCPYPN